MSTSGESSVKCIASRSYMIYLSNRNAVYMSEMIASILHRWSIRGVFRTAHARIQESYFSHLTDADARTSGDKIPEFSVARIDHKEMDNEERKKMTEL